jgi:hypothetical protein
MYSSAELFLEHFKMKAPDVSPPNTTASGGASGAIAGAATGALISGGSATVMSNSGSNNVEKCPLTDDSLYCQVSRTAGITGMVIYILLMIIFVLAFFYFLYYMFFRSGGSNVSKNIRRSRK